MEIGRKYGISEAVVKKIWKKFQKLGTVADKTGRGRKRKTNPVEDYPGNEEKSNCYQPCDSGNHSDKQTVRRKLREAGLRNSFALCRLLIRKANKIKYLEFAKKYADKPVDF